MQHKNNEGILLLPNRKKGELAVLNPTLHDNFIKNKGFPFLYRTRRIDEKGEYSTIDFRWLKTPTKLSKKSKILIKPEYNYEKRGCEDPRISKIDNKYYIVYIGFDGINAIPCLATTKDFKKIKKYGPIGPTLELKEAINLIDNKKYKNAWEKHLEKTKHHNPICPYNKDACIFRENNQIIMIHRIEPDIQISFHQSIEELTDKKFWRNWIKNFDKQIILKSKNHEKIGLGSPPIEIGGRLIALYHIVDKKLKNDIEEYTYHGTFLEFDRNTLKIKGSLKNSLFIPREEDKLEEFHYKKLVTIKKVYFPTALLEDKKNKDTLWIYAGIGDKYINFKSTSINWLFKELDNSTNKIINDKK